VVALGLDPRQSDELAPCFDSSTSCRAVDVPFAATGVAGGPQAEIVPLLVAKMNAAGFFAAGIAGGRNFKFGTAIEYLPVGLAGALTPMALGTVTTKCVITPAPE